METLHLKNLVFAQRKVIDTIARNQDLAHCLHVLCSEIETVFAGEGARSSILLLQGDQLFHGAAPNLPKPYCEAINGVKIGQGVGSCGTAAFTAQQVVVSDIEFDALWSDYAPLALEHNLLACWSTPIKSSANKVLGTFAIYYDRVMYPDQQHLEVIDFFCNLASLAIEKYQTQQREQLLKQGLSESLSRYQAFSEVIPDLAFIYDEDGTYVDMHTAEDDLLFCERSQVVGLKVQECLPHPVGEQIKGVIDKVLATNQLQTLEYALTVPKGHCYFEGRAAPVEHYTGSSEKRHVVWISRDITERKHHEKKIESLANFDALTGLPNRQVFLGRLAKVLQPGEVGQGAMLLVINLDDFKTLNQRHGHSVADEVLCQVSDVLISSIRQSDVVARLAGDEFAILMQGNQSSLLNLAQTLAQSILHSLQQTMTIKGQTLKVGASIALVSIDDNFDQLDQLLQQVDRILAKAKTNGKGKICR